MIHDWLRSGEILHPYEFAKRSYVQYPAFHLPYHPPVYPGLLGLFFTATGVSYSAARCFTALCLWIAGCFFYRVLLKTGTQAWTAFLCSALLITFPEIAYWSRDTMSEIPALALIMIGTYCFLVWLESQSTWAYVAAFAFAEAAFLSRYLTAGIIPAWFLWAFLARKAGRFYSWIGAGIPAAYLIVGGAWVMFSLPYSLYETRVSGGVGPNRNYADVFTLKGAAYYAESLPAMLGWIGLLAAVTGLVCTFYEDRDRLAKWFWACWLLSYCGLIQLVGIYDETRYFIFALPAFAGWIVAIFRHSGIAPLRNYLATAMVSACLLANVIRFHDFPQGVTGYERVAATMAGLAEPGNVLISLPEQAHLMFLYRSHPVPVQRSFIRADRTLVIRSPSYTDVPVTMLAHNQNDVLQILKRGRIRYIVNSASSVEPDREREETRLLNKVLASNREWFKLLAEFPLELKDHNPIRHERVALWQFLGPLPLGPGELPVVIPTAGFSLAPGR
ncbi:MAG: glycosyltransferase family 39 protein [Acidobacteriota bacterium]